MLAEDPARFTCIFMDERLLKAPGGSRPAMGSPFRESDSPAPSDQGDASLFAWLATGDSDALDALLQRHWSDVVAYVRSLLDDTDLAHDVAQESFLYVWEGREQWASDSSARALLFKAARSRSLNHMRHLRVRSRAAPWLRSLVRDRSSKTPLQLLEQSELRTALQAAVSALPPRRREVFTLGYIHECPHAEIATIMGISHQTARNHMSAALADLRVVLKPFLE
jgi:RNA polymerase sigma-70 factor, ECF subfamily